jgi:ketosteroid isomerase-like protein
MSQENVEVVQAGFHVWNTGDMVAFRELLAPKVAMKPPSGWPEPGPFLGRDATMRQFAQLRETWDRDTAEPVGAFIDMGDRVAVRQAWRGEGQGPESVLEWTASGLQPGGAAARQRRRPLERLRRRQLPPVPLRRAASRPRLRLFRSRSHQTSSGDLGFGLAASGRDGSG